LRIIVNRVLWVCSELSCFGSALILLWRTHVDLGCNWSESLELRASHQLITTGVYSYVRHPMYASIWLWGLAQALLLHNFIAGFAQLVLFAPLYFIRVPREERMMLDRFGASYASYMKRTGRILPLRASRD
jgi:protein-S-isoprenylcysteine O-methyltransferase Ste14